MGPQDRRKGPRGRNSWWRNVPGQTHPQKEKRPNADWIWIANNSGNISLPLVQLLLCLGWFAFVFEVPGGLMKLFFYKFCNTEPSMRALNWNKCHFCVAGSFEDWLEWGLPPPSPFCTGALVQRACLQLTFEFAQACTVPAAWPSDSGGCLPSRIMLNTSL